MTHFRENFLRNVINNISMKEINYIDNNELLLEMEKWQHSAEKPEDRIPSERLGELLLLMHNKILQHRNFNRYRQDLKDEMRSYSLYRIIKCGLKSFKMDKATPFSYFTRAIFTNYIAVLKKYYTQLNRHQEYVKGVLVKLDTHGDPKLEMLVKQYCISGESK